MAHAFKFIHAADFHLDEPIRGLSEIPAHLKSTLTNAAYEAAERIFNLAISERVDFVLLAGDLLNQEKAGPRSSAFLLTQFRRLEEKGIAVYWCGGAVDHPERWPASIQLPENVITFCSSLPEAVVHHRGTGRERVAVATIVGLSHEGTTRGQAVDFSVAPDDPFPIALLHGEWDSQIFLTDSIQYWAFGGRHEPQQFEHAGIPIVYPGTPQGRGPEEAGPHGARLCRVDSNGKLRVQDVETDLVRWWPQQISIDEKVNLAELKDVLADRALKVAADTDVLILATWHLEPSGEFHPRLRQPEWREDLLRWLRDEFGGSDRGIWTTQLTIAPPHNLPSAWYEEDTILGEFLRAIGRYQGDESIKLALHQYLPHTVESETLAGIGQVSGERRREILQQAALIGIDHLAVEADGNWAGSGTAGHIS